jgi:hypothetical protein
MLLGGLNGNLGDFAQPHDPIYHETRWNEVRTA